MAGVADEIFGALVLAGSERAKQAHYDKEAFAREKRGYAAQLRVVLSYMRQDSFYDAGLALEALIADLEGE